MVVMVVNEILRTQTSSLRTLCTRRDWVGETRDGISLKMHLFGCKKKRIWPSATLLLDWNKERNGHHRRIPSNFFSGKPTESLSYIDTTGKRNIVFFSWLRGVILRMIINNASSFQGLTIILPALVFYGESVEDIQNISLEKVYFIH